MKITMLEERRENLTSIIRKEMQKYPEIEKEIISNLGPAPSFLFNYPQLKSNLTITKTVDDIVKIQDQVYEMRGRLIESLQCIYLREISPWTIYVKSYEKFFGERNPIFKRNLGSLSWTKVFIEEPYCAKRYGSVFLLSRNLIHLKCGK